MPVQIVPVAVLFIIGAWKVMVRLETDAAQLSALVDVKVSTTAPAALSAKDGTYCAFSVV